jgi:uncharacterized protein YkwD
MTHKTTHMSTLMSLVAIAALSACGGGGDSSAPAPGPVASTPAPAPAASQAPTIVSAVAQPSYATTEHSDVFYLLNQERSNCGFGLLAQKAPLDKSATSHVNFLAANIGSFGHRESPGLPFFTGVTETDRAVAAGYTTPVTAVLFEGFKPFDYNATSSVRGLLAAPYHLLGMIGNFADVGIGQLNSKAATNDGYISRTNITLGQRSGVNDLDGSKVYTYPCAGSTGVNAMLSDENPSPLPTALALNRDSYKQYGTPIAIKLRTGKVLKVTNVTISPAGGGAPIATVVVDKTNDPLNGTLFLAPNSEAYALPVQKLLPLTTYTFTVTGTSDGVPFTHTPAAPFVTGKCYDNSAITGEVICLK